MDVNPGTMGERAGTRSSIWAAQRQPASPWRAFLCASAGWLIISVTVLRFTLTSVAIAGVVEGVVFLMCALGEFLITSARSGLPLRRRLAGYAVAAALAPLLTALLAVLRGQLNLTTDVLAFLAAVIAVALAGGLLPAVLEAGAGWLLLNFYFTPPVHTFTIAGASNAAALGVFIAVALVVGFLVDVCARRTGQAAHAIAESELLASAAGCALGGQEAAAAVLDRTRAAFGMDSVTLLERGNGATGATGGRATGWTPVAVSGGPPPERPGDDAAQVPATDRLCLALRGRPLPADRRCLSALAALPAAARDRQRLAAAADSARPVAEADRMRTALLAAVSHDLHSPLAAAKVAVSCLRSRDIELTAADHDDLLATAEESLDLLTRLVAGLLDVSRLQAGALPVFPRPANLEEIIARSLDDIGPRARAVMMGIPSELPEVMVDPPIMERVVANVTDNALRYSPAGSPPLLTASARGDRVELRVADRGPDVPEADRDRMFVPFQRLGDTDRTTGVGLGLLVARGLTEAMRGTLEPEQTPGGGLAMTIALPAAPRARPGTPPPAPKARAGKGRIGRHSGPDHDGAPSIARYWSNSVRAADVVSPARTAKAGGIRWHVLRRLGRETPHGNVG